MHSMWRLYAVVTAAVMLAGCVEDPDPNPPVPPADGASVMVDPDRPDTSFGTVATGPSAAADLNATLAAAPRLVVGEWWRIEFASSMGIDMTEMVRVVAHADQDGYIVGMPHEGWFKEAMATHAPGFGDIGLNLSWNTHNEAFEPVRFPLEVGASWETRFVGGTLIGTVVETDEHTATVTFHPPAGQASPVTDALQAAGILSPSQPAVRLVYDARIHEIVEMESGMGAWRVVDHGYDYQGWVTVPRSDETVFLYGFMAAAGPQLQTLPVQGGFNRVSIMHMVAPLAPGIFEIRATAPNGTTFVTESLAQLDTTTRYYEASDPDGDWTMEDLHVGAGMTFTMGIAYHQYDIRVPDGLRRTDHSHPVIR